MSAQTIFSKKIWTIVATIAAIGGIAGLVLVSIDFFHFPDPYFSKNSNQPTEVTGKINRTDADLAQTSQIAQTAKLSSPIRLNSVIIASTSADMERGLGGRTSLAADTGMLFVFDHAEKYGFWMKDMKFPIDIIWLDENLQIVHVERSLLPETYPNIFTPDQKSRYVLEVASGIAQKNNYSEGQMLDFLKPYVYMK